MIRDLSAAGSRVLALVLAACVVGGPILSRAAAAPQAAVPAASFVSGQTPTPTPTPTPIPITLTNAGSISANLTPSPLGLPQLARTPTITVASCYSPDYIFQGCPLAPQPGDLRPEAERRLEARAIASVLQQYQLPDSERPRVLRYARNEVRAALFGDVEEAFQTIPAERSPDQQLLVDVYRRLMRDKHVQAMRAAQNEYRRWAADPCGYEPPPGFTYSAASACIGASRAFTPESPGLQAFVAYGIKRAYAPPPDGSTAGYVSPSVDDPTASPVFWATSNAALLGYSAAAAGYAGAIGAAVGAALPASAVQAIFLFAGRTTGSAIVSASGIAGAGAAAVGGIVTVLVATVSATVTASLTLAREAALPDQLQTLVDRAGGYDVEYIIQTCVSGCVSATSTDLRRDAEQELFANLVLTTLPDYPGTEPAPAAQPGDPQLLVAGSPVDWVQYTADDGSPRAFRLSSGPWIADRAGTDNGAGVLTLSIAYKDAAGATWTARRVGSQFLIVRTGIPPTRINYPEPRQSADLSVLDWSGRTVTAQAGG